MCVALSHALEQETLNAVMGVGMQRVLGSLQAVTNLWVSLKSTVTAGSLTRSPVGDVWCDRCPHVDRLENAPVSPKLCPPVASLQGSRLFPKGNSGMTRTWPG